MNKLMHVLFPVKRKLEVLKYLEFVLDFQD